MKNRYKLLLAAAMVPAVFLAADEDPHHFFCLDGRNWINVKNIRDIRFSTRPVTEYVEDESGDRKPEIIGHAAVVTVYNINGEPVMSKEMMDGVCQAEFPAVMEIEKGALHPVISFITDDIAIEVTGLQPAETASIEDYMFEGAKYGTDAVVGWQNEGKPFFVKATCKYCLPSVFAFTVGGIGNSGTPENGTTTFEMPESYVELSAIHADDCFIRVCQNVQMAERSYMGQFWNDGNMLNNGVFFGGGEADVMKFYGDYFSADFMAGTKMTSFTTDYFEQCLDSRDTTIPNAAWRRYYTLLNNCYPYYEKDPESGETITYTAYNTTSLVPALFNLEKAYGLYPEERENLDRMKAELLTLRANAYSRLLQIYAPRWEDSDNGAALCLPLYDIPEDAFKAGAGIYVKGSDDSHPLLSMNEVRDLVYKDIDMAVTLFQNSKGGERSKLWLPDANVAYGVKARTALFMHDWQTASAAAREAADGYGIMDGEEYLQGFAYPTSESMWVEPTMKSGDEYPLYYWGFGAKYTYNGPYPALWNYNPGVIERSLFLKMSENDIRRKCFMMPETVYENPNIHSQAVKKWWDDVEEGYGNLSLDSRSQMYMRQYHSNFSHDNIPLPGYNYMTGTFMIGTQLKFWGTEDYGEASFPLMRASEMVLTRAEAELELGNLSAAVETVNSLVTKRGLQPLAADIDAARLREEIRLQRRLELWGEGHSWFDFKRWNLPIDVSPLKKGDADSGNFPQGSLNNMPADAHNGWTFPIPTWEYNRNKALTPAE